MIINVIEGARNPATPEQRMAALKRLIEAGIITAPTKKKESPDET